MIFAREGDLVTRRIAGETLIVPVRHSVGDLSSIYTLNESGTLLWSCLAAGATVEAMVRAICDEYEVEEEDARRDVQAFLAELGQDGLVCPADAQREEGG